MRIPQWFLIIWVALSLIVSILGSYFSYTQSRERTRDLSEVGLLDEDVDVVEIGELLLGVKEPASPKTDNEVVLDPTSTPAPATPTPEPTSSEPTATLDPEATGDPATATPEPTDLPEPSQEYQVHADPNRVTVLILGIDQRQGETGPFLTDTIIVLSIDPIGKTAAILSIPRDLYINYPGLGEARINRANRIGEEHQYPGGGVEFSKRTVARVLGIPIDYYVMVNFDSFMTLIDVIGDVEVCPTVEIDDPKYPDGSYGYKPIHFDPGCQALNAERLLEYSRTRATEGGDFDRANRQQEVILAVRTKVLSAGGVLDVVSNPVTLWDAMKDNVRTDINLNDMVSLALLAETVPAENIRQGQIGQGEVLTGTGPNGEQVLIPISGDISQLISDLFRPAWQESTYNPE